MHGYIVTTHYNNYELIKKCLDLLFENCICNSIVTLFVNETTDPKVLNIRDEYIVKNTDIIKIDEKDNNNKIINTFDIIFKTFYIEDQIKNNGLTGTWNQGIKYILDNYPKTKIITIIGHDTFLNSTINKILEKAEKAYNKNILEYYGPLCRSNKNSDINLFQDSVQYTKYNHIPYLTGFFMTFPINSLITNKIDNDLYFDEKKYPFAGNEVEWYDRFKKKGGKAHLCTDCIIDHEHERSWLDIYNNINKLTSEQQKDILKYVSKYNIVKTETKFNWMDYAMANRDLRLRSEMEAINHYMTIGKQQNRPLRISY